MSTEDCLDIPFNSVCVLLRSKDLQTKKHTLEYILLLTASLSNHETIDSYLEIAKELINTASTFSKTELGQLAMTALINITGNEEGATAVYETEITVDGTSSSVLKLVKFITERENPLAELACKVLANMTIAEKLALRIAKVILHNEESFRLSFEAIHNKKYNSTGCSLSEYLPRCFGNLAQCNDFQKYLLSAENGQLFCSIIPVIHSGESTIQKHAIASTVYNCLFDSANHNILLNEPFNILPSLLLPLSGPEEFDEEDTEKMPIELQYLGNDKEREKDPEIRKLLLKSLLLLCATKQGRIFLRDRQAYQILREYHKWEKDSSVLLACENVVDILIKTEDEIGVEDLKNMEVPEDLIEKFNKMDSDFINS